MSANKCLFLLLCLSATVVSGYDYRKKKSYVITGLCTKMMTSRVAENCVRYVNPVGDDLRLLEDKEYEWEVVKAENGGYHIRHCEKKNKCLYWYDNPSRGRRKWLKLGKEPISRFNFTFVGEVKHRIGKFGRFKDHFWVDSERPVLGSAYIIESLTRTSWRRRYVTYNHRKWLLTDDDDWYWLITPKFDHNSFYD